MQGSFHCTSPPLLHKNPGSKRKNTCIASDHKRRRYTTRPPRPEHKQASNCSAIREGEPSSNIDWAMRRLGAHGRCDLFPPAGMTNLHRVTIMPAATVAAVARASGMQQVGDVPLHAQAVPHGLAAIRERQPTNATTFAFRPNHSRGREIPLRRLDNRHLLLPSPPPGSCARLLLQRRRRAACAALSEGGALLVLLFFLLQAA